MLSYKHPLLYYYRKLLILTILAGNINIFNYNPQYIIKNIKCKYAITIEPANGLNNTHIPTATQL